VARLHELSLGKIGGHKYLHGLYGSREARGNHEDSLVEALPKRKDHGGGAVYVGAGIGAAVMPLRLGDRGKREVTIFELGAEPTALDEHHTEQEPMPGRKPSQAVMAKRAAAVVRKRILRERRAARSRPL
jgi:hypothetical protein